MGFELRTLVVIDADCMGSLKSNYLTITIMTVPGCIGRYKSNYHTITTMMAPIKVIKLRSKLYIVTAVTSTGHYAKYLFI